MCLFHSEDPVHKDIFRLAVCASSTEIHEQLWDRIVRHFQRRIPASGAAATSAPRHTRFDSDDEDVIIVEDGDATEEQTLPSKSKSWVCFTKYDCRNITPKNLMCCVHGLYSFALVWAIYERNTPKVIYCSAHR